MSWISRMGRTERMPSIRGRLARVLLGWSLLWTAAVSAAVWLSVRHEIDEQLDERLEAAADMMGGVLGRAPLQGWREADPSAAAAPTAADIQFTWQLLDADGAMVYRAGDAPAQAFHAAPRAGLSNVDGWRVYGHALGPGLFLYVAHERAERRDAQVEVALSATLSALAMALVGHLWLRARFWQELQPLQRLSQALEAHDPAAGPLRLGAAQRAELQPLHRAVDVLSERLQDRIRREQGFSAHAAHAMRTPLAGIDAQVSIALREAPAELRPRLLRVRDAARRLQHVVAALLGLFRAEGDPRREPVDLAALAASLPELALPVQVQPGAAVDADPDLIAATLINLVDNSQRHGARMVRVGVPAPQVLRVDDDGRGVPAQARADLVRALAQQDYEALPGLGLVLADVVARAHGGAVALPPCETGFSIELRLSGA